MSARGFMMRNRVAFGGEVVDTAAIEDIVLFIFRFFFRSLLKNPLSVEPMPTAVPATVPIVGAPPLIAALIVVVVLSAGAAAEL